MSDATFRARLKAILDGVSTAKNVSDYLRYFNELDDYTAAFRTADNIIHCWMITLAEIPIERPSRVLGGDGIELLENYTYNILGYYGVDDSAGSEKVFVPIVEAVKTALNSDTTLHTSGATFRDAPPCQVVIEPVIWGGVLCHRATITQMIQAKVNT